MTYSCLAHDWLTDWLTDWYTYCLTDLLTDWLTHWQSATVLKVWIGHGLCRIVPCSPRRSPPMYTNENSNAMYALLRTSRTWRAAAGEKSWGTLYSSCGPECWTCGWWTCRRTSGGGREAATSSTGVRWTYGVMLCHRLSCVDLCSGLLGVVTGSSFRSTTRGILVPSRTLRRKMARSSHLLHSFKLYLFAYFDLILLLKNNHRTFTYSPFIWQEEKEFQERFLVPILKTLKEKWVNGMDS